MLFDTLLPFDVSLHSFGGVLEYNSILEDTLVCFIDITNYRFNKKKRLSFGFLKFLGEKLYIIDLFPVSSHPRPLQANCAYRGVVGVVHPSQRKRVEDYAEKWREKQQANKNHSEKTTNKASKEKTPN